MDKKCPVVMLPTNQKAINGKQILLHLNKLCIPITGAEHRRLCFLRAIPQELYILSDDEIKEGDWYYCLVSKDIFKKGGFFPKYTEHTRKKIIATTDSSLKVKTPSQSFIQKFVEEYNKGNIITEVIVEYVDNGYEVDMEGIGGSDIGWFEKLEPKINSKDNTITIRKIKDSWNKKEQIELIDKLLYDFRLNCLPFGEYPDYVLIEFKKEWIKKNL